MRGSPSRRGRADAQAVFLNVPFDRAYEGHLLALIAGLTALGLVPRSSMEIEWRLAGSRLQDIIALLRACEYSLHDFSRVQARRGAPRFNMPFEAGLAYALELSGARHRCYILEARPHRLQTTCSDLNGIDPQIHGDRPEGVMLSLLNIFGQRRPGVEIPDLMGFFTLLRDEAAVIRRTGVESRGLYEPAYFRRLVLTGQAAVERLSGEIRTPTNTTTRARKGRKS